MSYNIGDADQTSCHSTEFELLPSVNTRDLAPGSFLMGKFPALRSSATPFGNAIGTESGGKLNYANLLENQQAYTICSGI
ncbi:hypothetical protein INT48_000041 [Thamnidium elegans]|uniref:Uncharacterized protein n=1 Tax=Thamnidium elegans TaxID=101142 RepID=A0A8H7VWI9_9FUNG|nr:hypothetical protein INT48_000041 [Thamnidium elegans]